MAFVLTYVFLMLLYPLKAKYDVTVTKYWGLGCPSNGALIPYTQIRDECDPGCEDFGTIFSTFLECTKIITPAPTHPPTPEPTPEPAEPPTPEPVTPEPAESPSPEPVSPPTDSSSSGSDPHFHMWDGAWFSFHGECDIVLLQCVNFAQGAGLYIHARTEIRKQYSFIKNLAFRVGDDVFEVGGQDNYYLNGIARLNVPSTFAGFSVKRMNESMRCGNRGGCAKVIAHTIDFFELGKAVVTIWRDFLYIALSGTNIGFNGSVGLMGSWGKPGKFARDNRRILDDNDAFGEEWQVLKSEPMIFHEKRSPQHPQPCNPAPKAIERRQSYDPKVRSAAHKACSRLSGEELEMCIVDVLLTGDINMAFIPNFY